MAHHEIDFDGMRGTMTAKEAAFISKGVNNRKSQLERKRSEKIAREKKAEAKKLLPAERHTVDDKIREASIKGENFISHEISYQSFKKICKIS